MARSFKRLVQLWCMNSIKRHVGNFRGTQITMAHSRLLQTSRCVSPPNAQTVQAGMATRCSRRNKNKSRLSRVATIGRACGRRVYRVMNQLSSSVKP